MADVPKTVRPYYQQQSEPARTTLLQLRERILEVIPTADEVIKYAMPTFVVDGEPICGLMVHKKHIGFYPYSGSVLAAFPEITEQFGGTKSALHFPLDRPVPKSVIRRLVRAKLSSCDVMQGKVDLSAYAAQDAVWRGLGLSAPARRGLVDNGVTQLAQLRKLTRETVSGFHAVGPHALVRLDAALAERGWSFKKS